MPRYAVPARPVESTDRPPADDSRTQEIRLGQQIRQLRHEQGLTLVELATRTSLSHPFLSQLERGLARPSMTSLERIAKALHSSQSDLMARATDPSTNRPGPAHQVVRAHEGTVLPAPGGSARMLVGRTAHFHPVIYLGNNQEFQEYYQHPEDEFVHVVEGRIDVDLGEAGRLELLAGDSLYYSGGTAHRWRAVGGVPYRVLAVKEAPSAAPPQTHGPHTAGPDTDSPDTDSPDTDRPDTDRPDTDRPDTDRPDADNPAPDG